MAKSRNLATGFMEIQELESEIEQMKNRAFRSTGSRMILPKDRERFEEASRKQRSIMDEFGIGI